MTNPQVTRPSFIPSVTYDDSRTALEWLEKAFGFESSEVLTDGDGNIVHAEMQFGDGVVMIGGPWPGWDFLSSPKSVGGKNTQRIHVRIERDIDAHCERARKAGAKIFKEPENQFYGDRTYVAVDPEGHHWTFAQAVREVSQKDMEDATGFKFKKLA
jgi:uncharacterized glyoxalase superfamily protein PhnB